MYVKFIVTEKYGNSPNKNSEWKMISKRYKTGESLPNLGGQVFGTSLKSMGEKLTDEKIIETKGNNFQLQVKGQDTDINCSNNQEENSAQAERKWKKIKRAVSIVAENIVSERSSLPENIKYQNCPLCHVSFSTIKLLEEHIMRIHRKLFPCPICQKNFGVKSRLDDHVMSSHHDKVLNCSQCSSIFLTEKDLQGHLKGHNNNVLYTCDRCGKVFKLKFLLDKHMACHNSARPYQCESCGVCFKLSSALHAHKRTHIQTKTYKCMSCDKEFRSSDGIKKHKIKYHMTKDELKSYKKKIYTCGHCGKMTGQKHVHVSHVRSHTGEKPFVCSDCEKAFATQSALNVHRKKHHGSKLKTCDICKLDFLENSKYKRHLNSKKHKAQLTRLKSVNDTPYQNSGADYGR